MKKLWIACVFIFFTGVATATQVPSGETIEQSSNPMTKPTPIPNPTTSNSNVIYPSTSSGDTVDVTSAIDDNDITAVIQKKLRGDAIYTGTNIRVSTVRGVVYLEGTAKNQDQIDQAIAAARAVDGVKSVQSKVTVGP